MSSFSEPTLTSSDDARAAQPVQLWRNRDYLLLIGGQAVSLLGTQISLIAFPLLVLFQTGSPAQAGLIGSMRLLPYFLLSLPVGALIDRWDRKRVMWICDLGRAICLGSIPLTFVLGHLTLLQLYLVSLIEGTLFVFFDIAEVTCLPRVVSREQIPGATAQSETVRSLAFLFGPALGGIIYGLGRVVPFLVDTCSYLISVFSLFWIRSVFQEKRVAVSQKLWVDIRAGLVWLWKQPLIFFIAFTGTLFHILFDGVPLLLIVLGRQMGANPAQIGLVLAMDGVGSIIGSFLAGRLHQRLSLGVAMIGGQWAWTILWLLILLVHNLIGLSIILALIYVANTLFDIMQFSYRRALIPDVLQGRVNSVFRLISYSGGPIGLGLTGFLLQAFGPYPTTGILGIGLLGAAVLITLNPHVRRARPLSEIVPV